MRAQGQLRIFAICAGFVVFVNFLTSEPLRIFGAPNTNWIVNSTVDADDGSCGGINCTLREAINLATSGDTINFDSSILPGTIIIDDTLGELTIDKDLTIRNTSKTKSMTISGNDLSRIFHVEYHDSLTLNNLILTQGTSYGNAIWNEQGYVTVENCRFEENGSTSASTGPIYNDQGTMEINRSVFFDNAATQGGAIKNYGILTITNSTFEDNTAVNYGGAIYNTLGSASNMELTIENSTFTGNTATNYDGGAIYTESHGGVNVTNSTFFNNTAGGEGGAIFQDSANQGDEYLSIIHSTLSENNAPSATFGAGVVSFGYLKIVNSILVNSAGGDDCYWNLGGSGIFIRNLILANAPGDVGCGTPYLTSGPMLDSLADNGGFTETMALLSGSPAIDEGHADHCPPTDQRGLPRPQGGGCDLGAYELDSYPTVLSIETAEPNPTNDSHLDFTVTFN